MSCDAATLRPTEEVPNGRPSITPLPGCGVRVEGLDLQRDSSLLRRLLRAHGLLLIPGWTGLTPELHLDFTAAFGAATAHPLMGQPPDLPCLQPGDCRITVASNEVEGPFASPSFQADHCVHAQRAATRASASLTPALQIANRPMCACSADRAH